MMGGRGLVAGGKELDALLDELVRRAGAEEIFGRRGVVKQFTKPLAERALEGEMMAHVGYEKNAIEGSNRGNFQNDRAMKRVQSGTAELEIEVPRDRAGTFQPVLIRKWQRRLPGFDDKYWRSTRGD
jgi:putative transposase